jgi:acetyltransferase
MIAANTVLLEKLASGFQPVIGHAISIRALRPDDFEIEGEFIRGLSVETRNRRLLGGARPVTDAYVARLTRLDYPRELALAAVVMLDARETLIGVARYALETGGAGCEFAIVVADSWQGRGIGTHLVERLIEAARAHAIASMSGYILATNGAALGFARKLGFRVQRVAGDATVLAVVRELQNAN